MTKFRLSPFVLTAMILMAVFVGGVRPAVAQESTPIPTELIQLDVVATTEAGAPVYGVILPTVAVTALPTQTPPAAAVDGPTTASILNWLMLIVLVLVVGLLVLVFMVLRQRAASGDETAMRWLKLFESGRNTFLPAEQTEAWLAAKKEAAKKTTDTILDDALVMLINAGYHVIAPQPSDTEGATTQTVTATVTSTTEPTQPGMPYPPATGRDLGTDLTSPQPDPSRPTSDGGAVPGTPAAFPRTPNRDA